ncbi:hypothetical protein [Caminibacter pacificus]|jgi:hypothetical protein
MKDNILELAELFKNIGLGLFVNGSYGILTKLPKNSLSKSE